MAKEKALLGEMARQPFEAEEGQRVIDALDRMTATRLRQQKQRALEAHNRQGLREMGAWHTVAKVLKATIEETTAYLGQAKKVVSSAK